MLLSQRITRVANATRNRRCLGAVVRAVVAPTARPARRTSTDTCSRSLSVSATPLAHNLVGSSTPQDTESRRLVGGAERSASSVAMRTSKAPLPVDRPSTSRLMRMTAGVRQFSLTEVIDSDDEEGDRSSNTIMTKGETPSFQPKPRHAFPVVMPNAHFMGVPTHTMGTAADSRYASAGLEIEEGMTKESREEVLEAAKAFTAMAPTPVSVTDMLNVAQNQSDPQGTRQAVATFLHRELPLRIAHRITELQSLPYGLSETRGVKQVLDWYTQSFSELVAAALPTTAKREAAFSEIVQGVYERHSKTLVSMSAGLTELAAKIKETHHLTPQAVHDSLAPFLDCFYSSRIGMRTLMQHYLLLNPSASDGWAGVIQLQANPSEIVEQAGEDAAMMCEREFGDAPEVIIKTRGDITMACVPSYVHHIMFELIKNSMRATVETHANDDMDDLPPVHVTISGGKNSEDVVIKVSDEGGGIPRSTVKNVWAYMYTTAKPVNDYDEITRDFDTRAPLAGLGYGLPISRLYARYWGGDLQLVSMEGFGTDAYVHLPNSGHTTENVPSPGAGFWQAAAASFGLGNHPAANMTYAPSN